MFPNTKSKLEDTRIIFEQLKQADDTQKFKALFNSFLSSARAITYALQKEGKKKADFEKWYKKKQKEMKNDELLSFVHEARTEDFHEGKHRLNFSSYFEKFETNQVGAPPTPDAKIAIGAEGPYWIINHGKPDERRVPIKDGGNFKINISINNGPKEHLGKRLQKNDPITICYLTIKYFEKLVHEAQAYRLHL